MSVTIRDDLVHSRSVDVTELDGTSEFSCAPGDHQAAGYTVYDDGTPMSINMEMIAFIEAHGGTFEEAAQARQEASSAHNRRETPRFAESIVAFTSHGGALQDVTDRVRAAVGGTHGR